MPPALALRGQPLLGEAAAIGLTRCVGGAPCVIAASVAGSATVPFGNGQLLLMAAAPVFFGTTNGANGHAGIGSATFPMTVPALPALRGLRLNWQGFVFDPGVPAGFASSAGVETWVL